MMTSLESIQDKLYEAIAEMCNEDYDWDHVKECVVQAAREVRQLIEMENGK